MKVDWTRRRILQAMGASAFFYLPLLRQLRAEAAEDIPKRAIFMFSPNGVAYKDGSTNTWRPTGDGANFQFSESLQPLSRHKKDLLIVSGLNMSDIGITGHNVSIFNGGPVAREIRPKEDESIDQYLGRIVYKDRVPKARVLNIAVAEKSPNRPVTYNQNGTEANPEFKPSEVFDDVFSGFRPPQGSGDTTSEPTISKAEVLHAFKKEKALVDYVHRDLDSLKKHISRSELGKIDSHISAIDDLEKTIKQTRDEELDIINNPGSQPKAPSSCQMPKNVEGNNLEIDVRSTAMIDLLVMALACNLTRIVSFTWEGSVGKGYYTHLNGKNGLNKFKQIEHHNISHLGFNVGTGERRTSIPVKELELMKLEIDKYHSQQFAYMLDKLKQIDLGGSNLLDHSVVFWGNEMSYGKPHKNYDIPIVMAGSCQGYFKTGRTIQYPLSSNTRQRKNHTGVLNAISEAMGGSNSQFGQSSYRLGPLKELKG